LTILANRYIVAVPLTPYCHLGQTERGIEDFNEAIRLDPECEEPTATEALRIQNRAGKRRR